MSTTININLPNDADSVEDGEFVADYEFTKTTEFIDHTFLLGAILVPESRDKQGDVVSADEIEEACHGFMMDLNKVAKSDAGGQETDLNLFHEAPIVMGGADVVECYVTRTATRIGGQSIKKGSWMLGVRVYDEEIRKAVRDGQIRGFSIEGSSQAVEG